MNSEGEVGCLGFGRGRRKREIYLIFFFLLGRKASKRLASFWLAISGLKGEKLLLVLRRAKNKKGEES